MKFPVTSELACLLKTARTQNGIAAKDLAAYIHKSPSYLSKLESGDLKYVSEEMLTDILSFVFEKDDFYEEVLPRAVSLLNHIGIDRRIVDQKWLLHYDVVEREVVVPRGMSEDLRRNLEDAHISIDDLTHQLNLNVDSQISKDYPANQLIMVGGEDEPRLRVRVEATAEAVWRVFYEPDATVRYLLLSNIMFNLLRMTMFPKAQGKLPPSEAIQVLRRRASYLEQWDIHSLVGFNHLVASDEFLSIQMPRLDAENDIAEEIACRLRESAGHDALNALNQMDALLETFDWDPAFACKIIGLPFAQLGNLSYANKRNLLMEIEKIVERYADMDEFERKMEIY